MSHPEEMALPSHGRGSAVFKVVPSVEHFLGWRSDDLAPLSRPPKAGVNNPGLLVLL